MATLTDYDQELVEMARKAQVLVAAVNDLAHALDSEAVHLQRLDQAASLRSLRARVESEVAGLQHVETLQHVSSVKGKLVASGLSFALGGLAAALLRPEANPLPFAARLAGDALSDREPYGRVVVAIGPGGVPDDVRAVSVSGLARELGQPEAGVLAALSRAGYLVFNPQAFYGALQELEEKALRGSLTLPVLPAHIPPADGRSA
jgi:hypothetical protein